MTSYHPQDIQYGYCSNCHDYTSQPRTQAELRQLGKRLCPMILTATNRPCLGQLFPSGIAGMSQCNRCGTWIGKTERLTPWPDTY
jgi:hypothetical protein